MDLQDTSLLVTGECDLSNNPLLGNPNIDGLPTCTTTGIYSAGLLPVTKSTVTLAVTARSAMGISTQLESTSFAGTAMQLEMTLMTTTTMDAKMTKMTTSTEKTRNSSTKAEELRSVPISHSFGPLNQTWTLFNLIKIGFKLMLKFILMIWIIFKTPWKREFKSKMKNRKGKVKNNWLLTS